MILIDSTFVNSLGGINILYEILNSIPVKSKKKFVLFIDYRQKESFSKANTYECYFTRGLVDRQVKFFKIRQRVKVVFSLGNVPLIMLRKRYQLTYNMQYFLFSQKELSNLNALKWNIKSKLIKFFFKISNSDVAAQTESMKDLFIKKFKINREKVFIYPIFKRINSYPVKINTNIFFYPSSGEKYKKVDFLINAFKLYNENFPDSKLYLTIDKKYKSLNRLIDTINEKRKIIFNKGTISHNETIDFMKKGPIIVHTSSIESFGLVLLESSQLNNVIIAPKLKYVFDVCSPSYTYTLNKMQEFIECLKIVNEDKLIRSKSTLVSTSNNLINYLLSK